MRLHITPVTEPAEDVALPTQRQDVGCVCLRSPPQRRREKHPDGVTLQGRGEGTQRLQRACGALGFFKGCFFKLNGRYVLISFISTL